MPVGIAGFIPLPYKIFTITAGIFLLDLKRFIVASAVGRSGRFFITGALIYYFDRRVISFFQEYYGLMAAMLLTTLIVACIGVYFRSRRHATPSVPPKPLEGKE